MFADTNIPTEMIQVLNAFFLTSIGRVPKLIMSYVICRL